MKLFSITDSDKFHEFSEIAFQEEHQEAILENWLENNPDKIIENGNLMIIGRQVTTNLGSYIDLLGIERQGDVVVLELKRNHTPRETLAQTLEYASFAEQLNAEQLEQILKDYTGDEGLTLAQYHRDYFSLTPDEAVVFNNDQRIVIVGKKITPEIRQTASFLRKKGVRVTCLEFTFFKADDGMRLLSTAIVVGDERSAVSRVSSGALPRVNESIFMASLDDNGRAVFERLLQFIKANAFPVHWGTKGFSANVNFGGTHVAFCYGYPPESVYKQSIYTALVGNGGLLGKIEMPASEIEALSKEALNSGLFQPAGQEFKCLINRHFAEKEIDWLVSWFERVANRIKELGLRGQKEP